MVHVRAQSAQRGCNCCGRPHLGPSPTQLLPLAQDLHLSSGPDHQSLSFAVSVLLFSRVYWGVVLFRFCALNLDLLIYLCLMMAG